MNRQQRRQIQRQGREAGGDGGTGAPDDEMTDAALVGAALADAAVEGQAGEAPAPSAPRSRNGRGAPPPTAVRHRVAPRQFLHEVNVELRKVAWPTRAETLNYSTVVFVTLAVLMALIFGLDLVFTKLAGFLFST